MDIRGRQGRVFSELLHTSSLAMQAPRVEKEHSPPRRVGEFPNFATDPGRNTQHEHGNYS
jgi:hypothetical protein